MKRPIQHNLLMMLLFLLLVGTVCLIPILQADEAAPTQPSTSVTTTVPPETTAAPTTVPPTTASPTVPPTTVPPATIPSTVEITAKNAFVYNCTRDHLAYRKDAGDAVMYPASITKLFSVYVALQHLEPSRMVTVGPIIGTTPPDSSFAKLAVGDQLTVKDLVAAMLLPSGGDAARVLAVEAGRAVAGDPNLTESAAVERFIAEMNRYALLEGMEDSHFVNPDGYHHEGHYTSLQDLLTIGKLSMETELIGKIAGMTEYTATVAAGRTLTWKNTNLLLQESFPEYYCPDAIGLKTGYTRAAGGCLLAAFEKDGEVILIGIFGSADKPSRFSDVMALYNALQ
jgi:D-alanyl-D-alanine carboxypeptidase